MRTTQLCTAAIKEKEAVSTNPALKLDSAYVVFATLRSAPKGAMGLRPQTRKGSGQAPPTGAEGAAKPCRSSGPSGSFGHCLFLEVAREAPTFPPLFTVLRIRASFTPEGPALTKNTLHHLGLARPALHHASQLHPLPLPPTLHALSFSSFFFFSSGLHPQSRRRFKSLAAGLQEQGKRSVLSRRTAYPKHPLTVASVPPNHLAKRLSSVLSEHKYFWLIACQPQCCKCSRLADR